MKIGLLVAITLTLSALATAPGHTQSPSSPRFEITIAQGLTSAPQSGRLFVIASRSERMEPRLTIGDTSMQAPPVFARDVDNFSAAASAAIDERAEAFPIPGLKHLAAGDYYVQALFDSNIDLKSVNAPGNLYSRVARVHIDPARGETVRLELTEKVPPEQLPAETEYVKYVKIESRLLSKFHGRPIYLRAGVILPRGFAADTSRRYPLRVHVGGYGSRFTEVQGMMSGASEFHGAWMAEDTPPMILLHLDGDGPFGDCYQVNSDNNGPYGDAITQELIPYVEQKFRAIGQPYARVVDGGSTGGWVSLALQVFYPDFFNGAWSYCPDGVDFRAFQLIDIYGDRNAYVNRSGFERPSARELNGDVRFTIRNECQMENVIGPGNNWAMSGEQWGAWNATYSARGADGRPVALWDPRKGEINRSVIEHWKRYDLRMVMEQNWKTLGPKLRGKINIWVGEADNYFLNNAVHLLDNFLSRADPPYGGKIVYGPGKGHCWRSLTERQVIGEMASAIERAKH